MSDWQWWAGSTEEHYQHGPFPSREAAVEALEGEGGWVTEATQTKQKLSSFFEAEHLLETAEDSIDHGEDEDVIFDVLTKDAQDLEVRVRATIDTWQQDHKLVFQGYLFTNQRHTEYVDASE